jgi:LacI family transcriptional regulator
MSIVSIKDVALLARVSVGTVSNVFNNPAKVSAATVTRVRSAIVELGFSPNEAARQLRLGKPDTIGLVVADGTNPFYRELARGVQSAALDHGQVVVTVEVSEPRQAAAAMHALAQRQRTRGLIVTCPLPNGWDQLAGLDGIHTVYLDQQAPPKASSVSVDNAEGGRLAAEHLVEIGRQRIAFLGDRRSGAQIAGRWRGAELEVRRHRSVVIEQLAISEPTVVGGRQTAELLADRPERSRPDGIFAANDLVAMGVLQALNGLSDYSVPRDVSLIGYDDTEYAAAAVVPLTSLRQPSRLMGELALELLVAETSGEPFESRQVVFQPTLMRRGSTRVDSARSVSARGNYLAR